MNSKIYSLPVALGLIAGCTSLSEHSTAPKIVFDPVAAAYTDYSETLAQPGTPVAFDSGKEATACQQCLSYKETAALSETTEKLKAAQEYIICDTVAIIRKAADNPVSLSPEPRIAEALAERLDVSSYPSSLFQRTDETKRTLAALSDGPMQLSRYSVQPAIPGWVYEVHVVARLDADGNGEEDWLVWLTDRAEAGSYDVMQAFIAYDVGEGAIGLTGL